VGERPQRDHQPAVFAGPVPVPPRLAGRDLGIGPVGFKVEQRGAPGQELHEGTGRRPVATGSSLDFELWIGCLDDQGSWN
jgi:hypothetical protein